VREEMKTNLQIQNAVAEPDDIKSSHYQQTRTEFFNGWMKEARIYIETFCVPLEQERAPEPLSPTHPPQMKGN
jgi:hypothetical protein